MPALLIPAALLLFAGVFLCRPRNGLGASVLKAALTILLVIGVSTQALSHFNAIARLPLVVLWILINVAALLLLLRALLARRGLCRLRRKMALLRRRPPTTRRATIFATLTVLIVLPILFSAASQYPYDADSLSYHMSRVANWINQGHVDFYPTVNQRQNFYAPGSEYAMLQIQLLAGTDKFSVMPQVVGMLLCFVLVAMLASSLRLGSDGAWFTVAASATIPILIGQAHCQQNELVVSALLLGFAWLLVQLGRRPRWSTAAWCGGALGLALLTKGTSFLYGAAIGLPLGLRALLGAGTHHRIRWRTGLYLATAVLVALALKAPFVVRCSREGRTYLKNEFTTELRTGRLGWDILAANLLRNGAVHLGLPDADWNTPIETWVRKAAGAQEANEESSFRSKIFMMHPGICCFYSPNPFHLVLALLAWLSVPFLRRAPRGWRVAYLGATVLSALLFNLCLKWQYWGIRLQLPWLLLMMPLVGAMLFQNRIPHGIRVVLQVTIAVGLFLGALPALLCDTDIPLWKTHKPPLVFRDAASIRFGSSVARFTGKSGYSKVVEYLRPFDPDEVGLILPKGNACHDYNWWAMFGTHARPGKPLIRHVAPDAWPPPEKAPPEWVIARVPLPQATSIMGIHYEQVFQAGACRVYRRLAEEARQP